MSWETKVFLLCISCHGAGVPQGWDSPTLMSQKLSPGPEDPSVQRSHPLGQKSLRMLMSAKSAR